MGLSHYMAFVRTYKKPSGTYYALVESYRDENGDPRQRTIKSMGTNPHPPPDPITLQGLDFATLATRLMDETLTDHDVFALLEQIGKKPADLKDLEAIGIRFDLAQKKLALYLLPKGYEWNVAPLHAPRAKAASGGKRRTTGPAPSPSKEKQQ